MRKTMLLLLALPLWACGSGDKTPAPAPKPTPVDPRLLLKCSGPLAFTHTGVVPDRFARRSKSKEEVYQIDLAHNIIGVWDDIGQYFEPLCRRDMATCKTDLGSTKFSYRTSALTDDSIDALSFSDAVVIDRSAGSVHEVFKLEVRRNHQLISVDVVEWNGKCAKTTIPLPITSARK